MATCQQFANFYALKDYFGMLTKCVDYAGALIFKYPH